jgi:hypothetical protein
MDKNEQITVRLTADHREYLDRSPGNYADTVRDLIEFERIVVRAHVQDIVTRFTLEEITAICDACRGTLYEAALYKSLPGMIADDVNGAVKLDGLATEHGVDGPALVEKILLLPPSEAYVMTRMIRAFWTAPSDTPVLERFKRMF